MIIVNSACFREKTPANKIVVCATTLLKQVESQGIEKMRSKKYWPKMNGKSWAYQQICTVQNENQCSGLSISSPASLSPAKLGRWKLTQKKATLQEMNVVQLATMEKWSLLIDITICIPIPYYTPFRPFHHDHRSRQSSSFIIILTITKVA